MKLSLEALKERAEATASNELLETISGGTANSCHKPLHQQYGGFELIAAYIANWLK